METVQIGGRTVAGFGVGDSGATMTPATAAKVSQGSWVPATYGVLGAVGGGAVGLALGSLVLIELVKGKVPEESLGGMLALSTMAGVAIGAGVGGAAAGRYGRRQDQAAALLAQGGA